MPNILPTALTDRLAKNEGTRQLTFLEDLLELRDFIEDNEARLREGKLMMQVYKEAAQALRLSSNRVRALLGDLREYSGEQLRQWIKTGLSFDHLNHANSMAELKHMTPAELLDFAAFGNAHGGCMTVDEMTAFVLGEEVFKKESYFIVNLFSRLGRIGERLNWTLEKRKEWDRETSALYAKFFDVPVMAEMEQSR